MWSKIIISTSIISNGTLGVLLHQNGNKVMSYVALALVVAFTMFLVCQAKINTLRRLRLRAQN